ncbi:acetyl-CoA carboxylase biotin carboxyl carrier protein [Romboutsia sp.]|uniref:acetyl-CoA carboxylase biotin carboxyl carrier protein n=1 Tax=Romboutsia sp. TaxID=1965302 RepID=UPI003F2E91A6
MNINDIKELLLVIDKTNLEYVKLENNELKLEASKINNSVSGDILHFDTPNLINRDIGTVIDNEGAKHQDKCIEDKYIVAPLMGTFYNASKPNEKSFVKVGDIVEKGDTLCILEAMKLMNEITSEEKCEIIEVLVENEELVEYNQHLFKIKPL